MNAVEKPITIYNRVTRAEMTVPYQEAIARIRAHSDWSLEPPPPEGWRLETPLYRATRNLHPAPKERARTETPWSYSSDGDCWQYAERPIATGEEIETDRWPHESMQPLNYAATQIHKFFTTGMRSRMMVAPVRNGEVDIGTGFEGPLTPVIPRPKASMIETRPNEA